MQEENSSFELLRIIAILIITATHFAQHIDVDNSQITFEPLLLNIFFAYLFGTYEQLGVCIFVVISSYFLCDSTTIHSKQLFYINLLCIFYSFTFYIIMRKANLENLNDRQLIKVFLSPLKDKYWFHRIYICFYLCIPILQFITRRMSMGYHKKLIIILTILIPIYSAFSSKDAFGKISQFIYIFFLVAYLKKTKYSFTDPHNIFILSSCLFLNFYYYKINNILYIDLLIGLTITFIFEKLILTKIYFLYHLFLKFDNWYSKKIIKDINDGYIYTFQSF